MTVSEMTRKDVFIFAAGAAVGGAVAWLIAKDHYTHLEIELPEYDIPEKPKEEKNKEELADEAGESTTENRAKKVVFEHDDLLRKEDLDKLVAKYSKSQFWNNPHPLEIIEKDDVWEMDEPPKEGPADEPYIISEEEFSEGMLSNDKVTLYYCAMDDTLIEEGVPYEEFDQKTVEDAIGGKNVDALKASDDGIIYVRNENRGIDYMIIMERDSYGADVLGASR